MTQRDKIRFLKKLKRRNGMARLQLAQYFKSSDKANVELISTGGDGEKLIYQTPESVVLDDGSVVTTDDDVFKISDAGKDFLASYWKDLRRTWYSPAVATLALFVATIALFRTF